MIDVLPLHEAITRAADYLAERYNIKSVGQVVARYNDGLNNIIYETFNERFDAIDMRRFHKAMLRQFAPEVFMEGMREGGITDIDEEDMRELDEQAADWLTTQLPYVNGFATDTVLARSDTELKKVILRRGVMWVNALRDLGAMGRAYANNNKKGQWILGKTEEHCKDCLRFSRMKPHRMSYFQARMLPRSPDLACHGFNCDCNIIDPATGASLL